MELWCDNLTQNKQMAGCGMHTFNSIISEAEAGTSPEFQASLIYIVNYRLAIDLYSEITLQKKEERCKPSSEELIYNSSIPEAGAGVQG